MATVGKLLYLNHQCCKNKIKIIKLPFRHGEVPDHSHVLISAVTEIIFFLRTGWGSDRFYYNLGDDGLE
jgi:hypothetical protein